MLNEKYDAINFVEWVYIPDLMEIAGFYKDRGAVGGLKKYLCRGDWNLDELDFRLSKTPVISSIHYNEN